MKKLLVLSTSILMVLLFACHSKQTEENATTEDVSKTEVTSKKYGVKSGIVHMEVKAMGMTTPDVFYFDNYGEKESHDMTVNLQMFNKTYSVKTRRIIKDNDVYEIDFSTNTYTKNPATPSNVGGFDLEKLKKQASADLKLEKTGTEEYLGKTCEKYTIESPSVPMKGTVLVYKNIGMKANITAMNIPTEMSVTKIEEGVAVPDSMFEVPSRVKLKQN